ncbi:MAG: hypothetical protein SGI77_05250 [Pirellulaceae bacterium]|nr:hypothetical protein [Pirellulaceae bacterium]
MLKKVLIAFIALLFMSEFSLVGAQEGRSVRVFQGPIQPRVFQSSQRGYSAAPATSPAPQGSSRSTSSGLPTGRTFYQGRYYGNPGNRYYGPQYGYF